jgi:hypothetical protein
VLVVASSCTVTVFAPLALDNVVTGISRFTVVDDAFTNRGRLVPLGVLRMNRGLSLLSGGLRRLLRGKPASPRGGTLSLLHGSGLEESSDFIAGPMGLKVRWLGHVMKEHGSCDHVLAGSTENRGVDCSILDDATINIVSFLSSSSAMCARRALLLEGSLK